MRRSFAILAVAWIALFTSCVENNGVTSIPPAPPPTEPDSVRVTLVTPDSIAQGMVVEFVLVAENLRDESVELLVGHSPWTFDFDVFDRGNELVWSRLPEFVPLVAIRITLQPHEKREFRDSWSQLDEQDRPVEPGVYTVKGTLRIALEDLVTDEKQLTITNE